MARVCSYFPNIANFTDTTFKFVCLLGMQCIGLVLDEKSGSLLPSYDSKTVLFDRNLTEKVEVILWISTSYQCQFLQGIFASIQRSDINGTALMWKCMVMQVNQ